MTMKTRIGIAALCSMLFMVAASLCHAAEGYTVVDTGQDLCFGNLGSIQCPRFGGLFYGQDAQYTGTQPQYVVNGDGTVTDLATGLMWQQVPDYVQRTFSEAQAYAEGATLAGYDDWRLPTIKELFSIAHFMGNMHTYTPYMDTSVFGFRYPDTAAGNRIMDAQYWSSNVYLGTTMFGDQSAFGFNFADGRIKSYPLRKPNYVRLVRGAAYGENRFVDNGDGTVTDHASGLTWMQQDSGRTMNWAEALLYAENLEHAGHDDWRLPSVKELQSIVDYSRAPDARDPQHRGPAIDPIFALSDVESWFWSSTTHIENQGGYYVCFGQAFSAWYYQGRQVNAHGAGAVRSDPKYGNPAFFSRGRGPQGDEVRIYNYVRAVRGGLGEAS